jgi:23S rRNA (adenine2503-C2)-methyltransferase
MTTEETTLAGAILPDPSVTRGKSANEIHPLARTLSEWESVLSEWGERSFRAKQVFQWIHTRGVFDPAEMTDLSKGLRERLAQGGTAEPGRVELVHRSADGTRKLLLELDRKAKVECVLIPMTPGSVDADSAAGVEDEEPEADLPKKRVTLCISTQFGCAMGCVFCASGQSGLFRGLGAAEVVYQVLLSKRYLAADEDLRNLVFMGMGEPLHHYEETARALRLLTHPDGGKMSPRRITVSTVGLVPGIRRLGEDFGGKIGLAVSLHAPDDEIRDRIMPMNKRYPIAELMKALREYPMPPRRRITIEYTLIGGVNDQPRHADKLAELLRPLRVKLNLIPMNPIEASELKAPDPASVVAFRERMANHGYSCFVRTRRGDDVSAACGQLALQAVAPERLVRR